VQASAAIEIAKHTLLSGGLILAIGTLTGLLAQKIKIPDVALFLIVGMAIGPEVSGLINIKADSALNQIILLFGASYILFDGGASLRFSVLKQVWITIVVIATVGVLITATITGLAAYYVLGVPVAMGTGKFSLTASLFDLLKQSFIGIIAGAVLGYVAALLIAHERWAFLSEYAPVVTLVAVIGAYFAADGLQASGFMAVFVFGIVIGNKDSFGFKMAPGEAKKLDEYVMTTAFIMRLFIFILLGAQVDFHLMGQYWFGGVIVIVIFMLVARPVTVFLCALPDRRAKWSFNEMLFMCWTRETGVIPAALAGLLLGMKAPGAQVIASVTFIAILMTILIQAPTTKWLGKRLGLLEEK
jgi:cell volume regulation protein A